MISSNRHNVPPHYFAQKQISLFLVCGLLLAMFCILSSSSFAPSAAYAAASIDYSALAEWKSVDAYAPVISVAFSPDQSMLAGGLDGKIEIYNDKLELIKELKASENKKASSDIQPLDDTSGQHNWMLSLAFSPDSKLIAAACYDGTVRIWDIKTGVETICKDPNISQDGQPPRSHKGPVRSIAFSPDGSKIVSGGDDKSVKLWDVKSGKLLWDAEEHVFRVVAVAFSADGTSISSFGAKDVALGGALGTGEFKTWDANTGQLKHSVTVDGFNPNGAGISPDGTVAMADGSVAISAHSSMQSTNIWDFNTGVCVYSVSAGNRNTNKVIRFSPDGTIAIVSDPHFEFNKIYTYVYLIGVRDGQRLSVHRRYSTFERTIVTSSVTTIPAYVFAVGVSKDNRSFAFGCKDGTIQIWRVP